MDKMYLCTFSSEIKDYDHILADPEKSREVNLINTTSHWKTRYKVSAILFSDQYSNVRYHCESTRCWPTRAVAVNLCNTMYTC